MPRTRLVVAVIIVGALLPVLLQVIGQRQVYWLFIVSEFFVYSIVAVSLDLLMGRTGQISLGHSGFFAVGAYSAAILNQRFGLEMLGGMLAGGLLSALASLVVGFPAARLRGHYLGIVTFGYGIAIAQIALVWDTLTGGDQGVHVQHPTLLGLDIGTPLRMYYVAFIALIVVSLLVWNLTRTRIGRAFAAVKDSETAAAAMGVPVARTKVLAFVCSAFLAGLAGGIYAFLAGFVAPEDFGIDVTLLFFAMVVIGGMGSITGAIGGAVIVDAVRHAAATVSGLSLVIVGGMIVLMVLFIPGGLKQLLRGRASAASSTRAWSRPKRVAADA